MSYPHEKKLPHRCGVVGWYSLSDLLRVSSVSGMAWHTTNDKVNCQRWISWIDLTRKIPGCLFASFQTKSHELNNNTKLTWSKNTSLTPNKTGNCWFFLQPCGNSRNLFRRGSPEGCAQKRPTDAWERKCVDLIVGLLFQSLLDDRFHYVRVKSTLNYFGKQPNNFACRSRAVHGAFNWCGR